MSGDKGQGWSGGGGGAGGWSKGGGDAKPDMHDKVHISLRTVSCALC